jgi:hypothetical protein
MKAKSLKMCLCFVLVGLLVPMIGGNVQIASANVICDVNGDMQVGLPEAIYALQVAAGIIPPPPDEKLEWENAVSAVSTSLAKSAKDVEDLANINEVLYYVGLFNEEKRSVGNLLEGDDFICGTFSKEGDIYVYTFDGKEECGGITGTVKITPSGTSAAVEFIDLEIHGCTINGTLTMTMALDNETLKITYTFTDLEICGNTLNGWITYEYSSLYAYEIHRQAHHTYTVNDKEFSVESDISLSSDSGINGTATMTAEGVTYSCTVNLWINDHCPMPVSGTLIMEKIVEGEDSVVASINFDQTTCTNKTAELTIGDHSFIINITPFTSGDAEAIANALAASFAGSQKNIDNLDELNDALKNAFDFMGGGSKRIDPRIAFGCGDFSTEGATMVFVFNGSSECGGVTGIIRLTPTGSGYSVHYDSFTTASGCEVNGSASTTFSDDNGNLTITHTFDNLNLCGQNLNDSVTMSYNNGILSVTRESNNDLNIDDQDVSVESNVDYSTENGFSGTAVIGIDDKVYNCDFQNIKIDPSCGVPTSGTLTIIQGDPQKAHTRYEFDFSSTTCEEPDIVVIVFLCNGDKCFKSYEITINFDEAMSMVVSK